MTSLGHILLLVAFVASGYSATAWFGSDREILRAGRARLIVGATAVLALTLACGLFLYALLVNDLTFAYVAQYSSPSLPRHYALSAFWVGQAGSLLLWCWLCGATALAFYSLARQVPAATRIRAFSIQMAFVAFLTGIMIFAADPMQANVSLRPAGTGLDPTLLHPAMLIHPPIVFAAYAFWGVPFSLAIAALLSREIDAEWIANARRWSVLAWGTLGIGILLGGKWAYEELGWGGYWAWDPVENGSLIPWLTGTALLHALILWHYRGMFKKTCLAMAIVTFAACQLATFLTRSGQFSSLHAFSESPIGWLFAGLLVVVIGAGGILILRRTQELAPRQSISHIMSRESVMVIGMTAIAMLAVVTAVGTLLGPVSGLLFRSRVVVGPQFYNGALVPIGVVLALATPTAPLLRWGKSPRRVERRWLVASLAVLLILFASLFFLTPLHPLELAVDLLAVWAVVTFVGHAMLASSSRKTGSRPRRFLATLRSRRTQYAGFLLHAGFMIAAVGIAGSSLRTVQGNVDIKEGTEVVFGDYSVFYAGVHHARGHDKTVDEAELQIRQGDARPFVLRPGQNYYFQNEVWTTEVAIHSNWSRDFYAIAHGGEVGSDASFTFMVRPRVRWLWASGWVMGIGCLVRLWPMRRRNAARDQDTRKLDASRPRRSRMSAGRVRSSSSAGR